MSHFRIPGPNKLFSAHFKFISSTGSRMKSKAIRGAFRCVPSQCITSVLNTAFLNIIHNNEAQISRARIYSLLWPRTWLMRDTFNFWGGDDLGKWLGPGTQQMRKLYEFWAVTLRMDGRIILKCIWCRYDVRLVMTDDLSEWVLFLITFGRTASSLLGEGPHPNLVSRFVGRTCKCHNKWYIQPCKLFCHFYCTYMVCKCCRGLHNPSWTPLP